MTSDFENTPRQVRYRTVNIDGLSVFYRESGPKEAPTILLLHRLPSSSRMFAPLFARLGFRMASYDLSFDLSEPEAYRHDVPDARVHILDGGHFALDTAADEIAAFVCDFL